MVSAEQDAEEKQGDLRNLEFGRQSTMSRAPNASWEITPLPLSTVHFSYLLNRT